MSWYSRGVTVSFYDSSYLLPALPAERKYTAKDDQKKKKKNTALLLEPIISDLSNLYFLLPTYRQILKQRLD